MNYQEIFNTLSSEKDVSENFNKNDNFYEYLLNNNVVYFYSKKISKRKNKTEEKLIKIGEKFNRRFIKTLLIIDQVCKKAGIGFLLFKTYKYIPEVMDGDIDLIIRKDNLKKFVDAISLEGFVCNSDGQFKWSCFKDGCSKIEPRSDISFHGKILLDESVIWKNIEKKKVGGTVVEKTTRELDVFVLLFNILYGPNYLKLYTYLVYMSTDFAKVSTITNDKGMMEDLRFLKKGFLDKIGQKTKFPVFLGNIDYLVWWAKRILFTREISFCQKLKHPVFFLYIKYKYLLFGKLHFRHKWE